jgi:hypothetical protein
MAQNIGKLDSIQAQAAYNQALRDLATAEQSGDTRAMTLLGQRVLDLQAAHPELLDQMEPSRQALFDGSPMVTLQVADGITLRAFAPEVEATRNLGKALTDIYEVMCERAFRNIR